MVIDGDATESSPNGQAFLFFDGKQVASAPCEGPVTHDSRATFRIGSRHQGRHSAEDNWNRHENDIHDPFVGKLERWAYHDWAMGEDAIGGWFDSDKTRAIVVSPERVLDF